MNDELDPQQVDRAEAIRELVKRGGLHEFIQAFWNEIETVPFLDNWHVRALCEYLEAVTRGDIKRLVINVPPGCMKSLSCGVFWPAYLWARDPTVKTLVASFDKTLVTGQAQKVIDLVNSEDFQAVYPETQIREQRPALGEFHTTAGGFRFSTSPEGKGTGRHVTGILVDDPMKPQDAINNREASFKKIDTWFNGTLQTRVREWIVLIMQRLHTNDLAGQCLEKGYDSLILPMRRAKRAQWSRDPRKEPGELLWPENPRFTEEKVTDLYRDLKGEASAQLDQDPTPMTGGIVNEACTRLEWIEVPKRGTFVQSWDFNAKGAQESHSKVSGALWCVSRDIKHLRELLTSLDDRLAKIKAPPGADSRIFLCPERAEYFLLIDRVGGHWAYHKSKEQFLAAQDRPNWRRARVKLIELKANGPALIEDLKTKIQGLKGVEPKDSKEERLRVHSDKFETMQVVFPPASVVYDDEGRGRPRPVGDAVREQLIKFPRFTWDDDVDTTTQALDRLSSRTERYRENLRIAAQKGSLIG